MIMKSTLKPEACANGDDPTRPQLSAPYLSADGFIMATDGRMAVRIPVQLEAGDTPGQIPGEVLAAARKAAGRHSDIGFSANGSLTLQDGRTFPRPDWAQYGRPFPDIAQVIPKGDPVLTVRVNPDLIAAVAKALGTTRGGSVVLEFFGPDKAVRVTTSANDGVGVFMVMKV